MAPTLSQKFRAKKQNILGKLDLGKGGTPDASPKGDVDEGVRDLIELINSSEEFVTTSSCSGRIAVFVGGKGGGNWLYTSHEPIDVSALAEKGSVYELLGISKEGRLSSPPVNDADISMVHLKFEPLILHILTANLGAAQRALDAALSAGFREAGMVGVRSHGPKDPATPMVAVRSHGMAFESVIAYCQGDEIHPIIPEETLRYLLVLANARFTTNEERKARFVAKFTSSSTLPDPA